MTPIGESSTPKVRRISVEASAPSRDRGEQLVVLSSTQGVLERGRFMDGTRAASMRAPTPPASPGVTESKREAVGHIDHRRRAVLGQEGGLADSRRGAHEPVDGVALDSPQSSVLGSFDQTAAGRRPTE